MSVWLIVLLIVLALLLAGAVGLWWTERSREKQVPRLEITMSPGSATTLRTTSVRGLEDYFVLKITNVGRAATTVEDIFLEVPDGWRLKMNASFEDRSLLRGDRPLPCRLDPGEAVSYGVSAGPLSRQLEEMDVYLTDQTVTLKVIDVDGRVYSTMLSAGEIS